MISLQCNRCGQPAVHQILIADTFPNLASPWYMLHTSSKRFAGWYQTANLLERACNKYHHALWLLRSSTNLVQKCTIAKWMESNKKTNDGSCISIQVCQSFQVTLKSPWVTKCSLFLLIDRSRFPRNSHSRRPDRPPLQDVPNLKILHCHLATPWFFLPSGHPTPC